MAPPNAPSVELTPENLAKQSDAFMLVYLYFIYKMQFTSRIQNENRIAGCATYEPNDLEKALRVLSCGCIRPPRVATFNQFIRQIMSEDKRENYKPDNKACRKHGLDTHDPDMTWVGHNLWSAGFSGSDHELLYPSNNPMYRPHYGIWDRSLQLDRSMLRDGMDNIDWAEAIPWKKKDSDRKIGPIRGEGGVVLYEDYVDRHSISKAEAALKEARRSLNQAIELFEEGWYRRG